MPGLELVKLGTSLTDHNKYEPKLQFASLAPATSAEPLAIVAYMPYDNDSLVSCLVLVLLKYWNICRLRVLCLQLLLLCEM